MRAARSRRFSWDRVALRHVAGAQSLALEISLPVSGPNPLVPPCTPFSWDGVGGEDEEGLWGSAVCRDTRPVLSRHKRRRLHAAWPQHAIDPCRKDGSAASSSLPRFVYPW